VCSLLVASLTLSIPAAAQPRNVKHVRQMMNFTNQGKARNKTTRFAASPTNHFDVRVDAREQTPSTLSTGADRDLAATPRFCGTTLTLQIRNKKP
jgi:hypothetical protein